MRLIDADALKDMMLQAYNDALPEFDMPWKKKMAHSVTLSFMADIDEAPTVDAVPVVRCKDCKYAHSLVDATRLYSILVCNYHNAHGMFVINDGFCAWGKRREEEHDETV